FLSLDSSVFHLFTADDPELPRELVLDADGRERFRKYVPTDRVMANLIENYPYPYVIGRLAWEIAPLMPSDWDAQHLNGKKSPKTTRDLKAAVDATVVKRGVFSLCFHAHGWIAGDQVVEMIDHAVAKYGRKVKFLSFGEVEKRINKNLLGGQPLRAANGQDNGVRILDVNHDGYMDVVVGNEQVRQTRVWSPNTGRWIAGDFPVEIVQVDDAGNRCATGVRFGVLRKDGLANVLVFSDKVSGAWHFDGRKWQGDPTGLAGLDPFGPILAKHTGDDRGIRLRDLDRDGVCELIVGNAKTSALFRRSDDQRKWLPTSLTLPEGTSIVDAKGRDAGLRFVDVDEDGHADVVFSNAERYSVDLFTSMAEGWSRRVLSGNRGDRKPESEAPMIVRADGTNNGAWFKYGHMWVQNEETGGALPDHVDSRRLAKDFLAGEKE
ncbi:MAG: VCBS repeat-containing protein, partial [Planctomycetes bacterium]|nr:VCBS repeat-containing protein [Planctomycetota bacterium]